MTTTKSVRFILTYNFILVAIAFAHNLGAPISTHFELTGDPTTWILIFQASNIFAMALVVHAWCKLDLLHKDAAQTETPA
jgi:hypothetical protein